MDYDINRDTSDSSPTSDAITSFDNSDHVPADIEALKFLKSRLSMQDFGRLSVQISRAAAAKRPSQLQRLLLSIIQHRGDHDAMNAIAHNQGPPLFDRHPDDHMKYVQWNIRDFLQGVRGMKPDQIGMYSIILLLIYDSMGMLRDDDRYIAGHLQLDIRYYRRLRQQLIDAGKIYEADGYLYNNRAISEIAKFCEMSKRSRDAAMLREAKKRAAAAHADERASGAREARDARVTRAPQAHPEHAARSRNSKLANENNRGPTRLVPDASIQREREIEIEDNNRHPRPAEPWSGWSDMEFRDFVERLKNEAGEALANPASAAGLLNVSPIYAWLQAGADPEFDIVPAIRMVSGQARVKGTQRIRSWEYFNTAVADCRVRRLKGLPAIEIRTKTVAVESTADRELREIRAISSGGR